MTLKRLKIDRFFLKPTNQASFKEALMLLNRTVNSLIVRVNEVAEYNTVSHEDIALAIQKADEVYTLADSAATDGAAALTTAGNALSVANGINAKATSALNNSNTAMSDASDALTAAGNAQEDASDALEKADEAIDTAEAADTKADQAIEDVNAMDLRVGFNASNVSSILTALGGAGGLPLNLYTESDFVGGAINELLAKANSQASAILAQSQNIADITPFKGELPNNADLDAYMANGVYQLKYLRTYLNMPNSGLEGVLICSRAGMASAYATQLLLQKEKAYFRFYTSTTDWGAWKQLFPAIATATTNAGATLLQSDVTLSTNESAYFTDNDMHNLYLVCAYDTTAGVAAWVNVLVPASDSVVRYAHTLYTDTLPFSLIRNGVNCTLKREGSSSCMYKVYGIK